MGRTLETEKKVVILQSNYIPWKGYFDLISKANVFIIYDEVQYTKNDWRNRNKIKTPNGLQWLTIPVLHNSKNQKIYDTKIASRNWYNKHWKTLQHNYSKAKFYKDYKDIIRDLYINAQSQFLSEINLHFIKGILELYSISTEIISSKDLDLSGDKNERLFDAIEKVNGTKYLSGPAAKQYLDTSLFAKNGISVEWMDYSQYQVYEQLYTPFDHQVSILDMIFNIGVDKVRGIF